MIRQYFPMTDVSPGWFYNQFFDEDTASYLRFSERKPFGKLVSATSVALSLFGLSESGWIAFPDSACQRGHSSSWRSFPRTVKWVQGTTLEELGLLIRQEFAFFREPSTPSGRYRPYGIGNRLDNYNIIDSTGRWAIVYGHHGSWYAFHRNKDVIKRLTLLIRKEDKRGRL